MNDFFQKLTENKNVVRGIVVSLFALALFLVLASIGTIKALGEDENPYGNTITIEGTGKAVVIPDVAQISFSVTERAATVEAAQTAATAKIDAALASLKEQGVEEKDIKTTSYNVYPTYEYQQPCYTGICPPSRSPSIIGYEVSQSIDVKVRNTGAAGTILQGLGSTGVQNLYGPSFTTDDPDQAQNDARAAAIADAKAKAKMLAKNLGVSLGKVVSFYENTGYPMYDYEGKGGEMNAVAQSAPAPTLPVGESEVSVSVSVTYKIH